MTQPDQSVAELNFIFDSYADGDISANEAILKLKGLLVDAQISELEKVYGDGTLHHFRVAEYIRKRIAALQQTRQEEVRDI